MRVVDGKNIERGRATLVRVKRAGVSGEVPMPGIVLTDGTVGTGGGAGGGGAGALEVVELQPEGKRPMSLAEYRNGHPWSAGMRLESIV